MTISILIGIIVALVFSLARTQWEVEKLKRDRRQARQAYPRV